MEDLIKKSKLQTSLHATIRLCNQFKAYIFFLLCEENIQDVTKNSFSILMNNTECYQPNFAYQKTILTFYLTPS